MALSLSKQQKKMKVWALGPSPFVGEDELANDVEEEGQILRDI